MALITRDLQTVLDARDPARVDITIEAEPGQGGTAEDRLRSLGISFDRVDVRQKAVFTATVSREQLDQLAAEDSILRLDHSPTFSPLGAAGPAIGGEAIAAENIRRITLADAMEQLNVPEAWEELGHRGEDIRIGMIDTSIDTNHPMLREAVAGTRENTAGELHGTWVASAIVGEEWDSGAGRLHGAAPDADLYAHGALTGGGASITEIADGISYCIDRGCDVINISFGGPHSDVLQSLIEEALNSGSMVVTSAGNSGPGLGSATCPAHHDTTLAVGSIGTNEEAAAFSARGPGWQGTPKPDLSAFGGNTELADGQQLVTESVLGAAPSASAEYLVGTSMAAPQVAGIAALGAAARRER